MDTGQVVRHEGGFFHETHLHSHSSPSSSSPLRWPARFPPRAAAVLKNIEYVKTDNGLEISVRIEGNFVHQVSVQSSPNSLVIDIAPAQRIEARPIYDVNAFGVTTIRTGQFQPQISRVIFDFGGPLPAYDIQKTDSGLMVKIGFAPKPVEKPAVPAVFPPPVAETKPAAKEEAPEAGAEASPEIPPGSTTRRPDS